MSLFLNRGTVPHDLYTKTHQLPDGDVVVIGDCQLSMVDFIVLAHYVLTNTDLRPDDPRRQFVKCVVAMTEVPGYGIRDIPANPDAVRLESSIEPVPADT